MNLRFLDYDFTKDPNYVRGYEPGAKLDETMFARYEDVAEIIPRDKWKDAAMAIKEAGGSISLNVQWLLNQLREGSCVGNGTTGGCQVVQAMQYGKERAVQMSAISLYKQIGGSAQSGASVNDALTAMQEVGELPLDTEENKKRFKHTMPATGFSTPYPDGWKDTAKLFRIEEATICKSVDEEVSAGLAGHPRVVGRDGHCIYYIEPTWDEKSGGILQPYVNSWGPWGDSYLSIPKGIGYDSTRTQASASGWCFAIRSVTAPSFEQ